MWFLRFFVWRHGNDDLGSWKLLPLYLLGIAVVIAIGWVGSYYLLGWH